MSHLRFRCSSCDKVLQIDESYSGQSIQCPSCQAIVQAPLKQSAPSEKLQVPPKPASKPVSSANRRLAPPKPKDQTRDDFASSPLSQSTYQNKHDSSWKSYQPEYSGPISAPPILPIVLVVIFAFLTLSGIGLFFGVKSYTAYASRSEPNESTKVIERDSPEPSNPATSTSANQQDPNATIVETKPDSTGVPATKPKPKATPRPLVVPQFPELAAGRSVSGIRLYEIQLRTANTSNDPGFRTWMRIYVPESATEPRSIPCVLVAPAGTNLLHGSNIDDANYHKETLPYARAGMAVVHYSIDGWMSPSASTASEQQQIKAMTFAFKEFLAADAGITNGRVALEFALARLPQVDPSKIYCAGHSSAATLAL
jgi:phage FluMu protein Com